MCGFRRPVSMTPALESKVDRDPRRACDALALKVPDQRGTKLRPPSATIQLAPSECASNEIRGIRVWTGPDSSIRAGKWN